jgi:hypothetical protein
MRKLIFALAAGLALAACESEQPGDQTAMPGDQARTEEQKDAQKAAEEQYKDVPEKARQALVIADEVEKNPAQLDSALQQNGMDRKDFDDLMYDVARDAKLSDAYLAKREGGAGQPPMRQ